MIDATIPVFPNNVVDLIAARSQSIDADLFVTKRPLRSSDPRQSVGVYSSLWTPDERSYEFDGNLPGIPTLQQYMIIVQGFVKDGDEESGLAVHSVLSNRIRAMLYKDNPLQVAFRGLSASSGTITERMRRWGVRSQRYFSNEIDAQWLYLSTLEFWMETETM